MVTPVHRPITARFRCILFPRRQVVGAPYGENDPSDSAGAAYLFEIDGGDLNFLAKLFSLSPADSEFGWSVGISNMVVVVGAPDENYRTSFCFSREVVCVCVC